MCRRAGAGTSSTAPSETRWTPSKPSPPSAVDRRGERAQLARHDRRRARPRAGRGCGRGSPARACRRRRRGTARRRPRRAPGSRPAPPASRAVESMTVSSPRRRRLATISSSTSRASCVARRSWRCRPTTARRSSDDDHGRRRRTTRRPTSTCPDPAAPDEHDEARVGQADGHRVHTRAPLRHDRHHDLHDPLCRLRHARAPRCAGPAGSPSSAAPTPAAPRRARRGARSPAGCATSCSGSSTATGGPIAGHLAGLLVNRLAASGRRVDVVTWAPTSARRRRERGFDQAELVARQVARQLGVPCRRLLERDGRRPVRRPGEAAPAGSHGPAFRAHPRVPAGARAGRRRRRDDRRHAAAPPTAALRAAGAVDVVLAAFAATPDQRRPAQRVA